MKMNLFLAIDPYEDIDYRQISMRIIKDFKDQKIPQINGDVVICKNNSNEILVANPNGKKTVFKGYLFLELVKLNLSDQDNVSDEDKIKIINFVSKYGIPYSEKRNQEACFRKDALSSLYEDGDKINWLFVNYNSKPQDIGSSNFFDYFKWNYQEFLSIYKLIEKEDYQEISNKYAYLFDKCLNGNTFKFVYNKNGVVEGKWLSKTCLDRCYLELYSVILTKQKIKTCKYCGSEFTSQKENRLRCDNCQNPIVGSKKYREKNKDECNRKARERMRKIRAKENLKNQTTL